MTGIRVPRVAALVVLGAATIAGACVPPPVGRTTPSPSGGASAATPTARPPATPAGPTPSPSFRRPTPTPRPTFLAYRVRTGDTLTSIARQFGTSTESLSYWNRATYPSLDPESGSYDPDDIRVGWTLLLVPGKEVDPEDLPPGPSVTPDPIDLVSPAAP